MTEMGYTTKTRRAALLLAFLFVFAVLPIGEAYAAYRDYMTAKAPTTIPNVGDQVLIYTFEPNLVPFSPLDLSNLRFDLRFADGTSSGATTSALYNMSKIWVTPLDGSPTYSAYCINKKKVYPAYMTEEKVAEAKVNPSSSYRTFIGADVEEWPTGDNYDRILWVLEHSYPAIPLHDMLEDAGVEYDPIFDALYTAYEASSRATIESMFSTYEEGIHYITEVYIYGIVQQAIWYHEGAPSDTIVGNQLTYIGPNMLTGPVGLRQLYSYLCKDRPEYTNYRNTGSGEEIFLNEPVSMKPLLTKTTDACGAGALYGPFTLTTNMLSAGNVTLGFTGQHAATAQFMTVTFAASGAVSEFSPITSTRINSPFYLFIPGAETVEEEFSGSITVNSTNARVMSPDGRGRLMSPSNATTAETVQNVGIGGASEVEVVNEVLAASEFETPLRVNITLTKTNREGAPLFGATFQVKDSTGAVRATVTTNAQGEALVEGLEAGTYAFEETAAPAGYVINPAVNTFVISSAGEVSGTLSLANDPTSVLIEKINEITRLGLPGAQIGVYESDTNQLYGTYTSDVNGRCAIKNIPAGNYYAKEITPPDGYVLNTTEYPFVVYDDGTATPTITIPNTSETPYYPVELRKVDADTGAALAGAGIRVEQNPAHNLIGDYTTDANGSVSLLVQPGSYRFYETSAPEGYVINSVKYTFYVSDTGLVSGDRSIPNEKINVPVTITKQDADTLQPLQGARIAIAEEGTTEPISTLTTNSSGQITIPLNPGNYKFYETAAPLGYDLNPTEYTFTVETSGEVTGVLTLPNTASKYPVTLRKFDSETNSPLAGARLGVYRQGGEKLFEGVTDANGRLLVPDLPAGSYFFKELVAPAGYVLDTTPFDFTISRFGLVCGTTSMDNDLAQASPTPTSTPIQQPVATPTPTPTPTQRPVATPTPTPTPTQRPVVTPTPTPTPVPLPITPAKGTVRILKRDLTNSNPVAGATVEVYNSAGVQVYRAVTGADGYLPAFTLKAGNYTFKETIAPAGYAINTSSFAFTVKDDGTVTGTTEFADDVVRFSVLKVDASNSNSALPGATMTLYNANSGQVIASQVSGAAGMVTFTGMAPGKYYIKETDAPNGYALANDIIPFEVTTSWINPAAPVTLQNSRVVQTGGKAWIVAALILLPMAAGGCLVWFRYGIFRIKYR